MSDPLHDYLTEALPEALRWLRLMVDTNSLTTNRAGIEKVSALTEHCFAPLGFFAERIPSDNPAFGQHLVLTRPGRTTRKIGLVAHLDTVFSEEEERANKFSWRQEGNRVYGPGTMDIKGGTMMIYLVLSALHKIAPALFAEMTWVILENSSEEVLSRDFGRLCLERLAGDGLAALVFEPGGRQGEAAALVTSRKGRATFRLTAHGRGAHAGGRHRRGANAIVQLAEVVEKVAALTNHDQELTFNVGRFEGGTVVNRVPHLAVADLEMRAFSTEAYNAGLQAMRQLDGYSTVASQEDQYPCRVAVELMEETPPWPENPGSQGLFQLWRTTAARLHYPFVSEKRGGISDGNYLWQALPTIDGLGPYGDNAHCSEQSADGSKQQEFVDISSFIPRAQVSVLAIQELVTRAGA